MDLKDRVAWITGGTRMGLAVARMLARDGCRIVFSYHHSKKAAEEAVRQLTVQGSPAIALRCDLTRQEQIDAALGRILRAYKRLDILVNLSAIYEKTPLSDRRSTALAWHRHMEANTRCAYLLSAGAAPAMTRTGGGRIIHISDWTSASGRPRYKGYMSYYVSKAAVKGVVESLALELAPKILVNAIAPGPILPPPDLSRADYQAVVKATPLARWGGAEEIAKTVYFLVQSDFVTGETIRVDGGRHLS